MPPLYWFSVVFAPHRETHNAIIPPAAACLPTCLPVCTPVLKVAVVALSVGILVELAILARITGRSRQAQMDWDPGTGLCNTGDGAHNDDEKGEPQRDNRMPRVDHTL
ncbi:hypothetical protein CSUB01_01732 [Colletotrichum sublineola]|uniref:Uncharacterized protein n=1 Tax=Colletotrichum sublineola TaxID=1173701 RepID=A0A066XHG0_COLSU|nr:hypothetical protein CSUB01_01732 [Colletotrichum sublineola]